MGLVIGFALFAAGVIAVIVLVFPRAGVPIERRRPVAGESASPAAASTGDADSPAARWSSQLSMFGQDALASAGLRFSQAGFLRMLGGSALAAGSIGMLVGGPLLALVVALTVPVAARLMIGRLADRRRRRFETQLPDTLQLLSGSLRAGHSILRAIDAAAVESASPTAEEMRRVVAQTSLGRDLLDALQETASRMRNEDVSWVAQAVQINREVGGNLAEVLDQVNETIRERGEIRGHIRALAAEGKFSAYILMAMPVVIVGILAAVNPGYMNLMFAHPLGWVMIAGSVVLLSVGGLWLRKIIDLKF